MCVPFLPSSIFTTFDVHQTVTQGRASTCTILSRSKAMPPSNERDRRNDGSRHASNEVAGIGSQFSGSPGGQPQRHRTDHSNNRHSGNENNRSNQSATSGGARVASQNHAPSNRHSTYNCQRQSSGNQQQAGGSSRGTDTSQRIHGPYFDRLQHNGMFSLAVRKVWQCPDSSRNIERHDTSSPCRWQLHWCHRRSKPKATGVAAK